MELLLLADPVQSRRLRFILISDQKDQLAWFMLYTSRRHFSGANKKADNSRNAVQISTFLTDYS